MKENCKKYLAEFIGTFFLVFSVASATLFGNDGVIAPLMIGFTLMVMVYAGGHISGGHYNPAVTLTCAIRGALDKKQIIPYWISQVLGAIAAVLVALPFVQLPEITGCDLSIAKVVIGEFLFTFALCYVVLQVATSKKTEGNSYYGLAIGSTVMAGAFAVGGICLGAFNPAVAISTIIFGATCCVKYALITVLVNLLAGALAGVVFKFVDVE